MHAMDKLERMEFIQLAKGLQDDIENYQSDYMHRNKSGKIKQMKLFSVKEEQVIRDWNNFKKESFDNLLDEYGDKYDINEEDVTPQYRLLFDAVIAGIPRAGYSKPIVP